MPVFVDVTQQAVNRLSKNFRDFKIFQKVLYKPEGFRIWVENKSVRLQESLEPA